MATADKQAIRNRKIVRARMEGQSAREIAEAHDLTPARVRQILASAVHPLVEDRVDPIQLGLELRAEFELVLDEAKTLASAIPSTNPAAKTGALKLVLVALERLTDWHRYMGVLPDRLDFVIDARVLVERMMNVLEQHNAEDESLLMDAMLDALDPESAGEVDASARRVGPCEGKYLFRPRRKQQGRTGIAGRSRAVTTPRAGRGYPDRKATD